MIPVATQCGQAIAEVIRQLGLPDLAQDEVKLRDMPSDTIAPRGISIIPSRELEGAGTNAKDDYGYPFLIVMSRGTGKAWSESMERLQLWRNSIRKAFNNKRLPEVDKVHICGVRNGDYLQPKQWQDSKEVSTLVVTCWSREART
jgi:type II secretory pathway pseudopilin PulG